MRTSRGGESCLMGEAKSVRRDTRSCSDTGVLPDGASDFGKTENSSGISTARLLCMGLFSLFEFAGAYPAPARFFCQTRCTAQVQPGGCEARSFDVSSFAGVATKVLSVSSRDGM